MKILKLCSFWLSKIIDRLKYADLKIFNVATILKGPMRYRPLTNSTEILLPKTCVKNFIIDPSVWSLHFHGYIYTHIAHILTAQINISLLRPYLVR